MNCKNCNTEVNHNFCPNCGQPSLLKRIDEHYIAHEIKHVLHFEKGILFTIKELLTKPGQSIREFISADRNRLVKPIIFVIITSIIYTLISHFFHIEEEYLKYDVPKESSFTKILGWMQANYGYLNILMGAFIAVWLKIFFRKYDYNFFELLIMVCYVLGISMLIFAFFTFIEGISHIKLLSTAGMIGTIYLTWATGNFFEKKKAANYFKALVCYLLGMLTFFILIFAIGITIDIIIKH